MAAGTPSQVLYASVNRLRELCDNADEYDGKRGEFYLGYESRGAESGWECEVTVNDPRRNVCTHGLTANEAVQAALVYIERDRTDA